MRPGESVFSARSKSAAHGALCSGGAVIQARSRAIRPWIGSEGGRLSAIWSSRAFASAIRLAWSVAALAIARRPEGGQAYEDAVSAHLVEPERLVGGAEHVAAGVAQRQRDRAQRLVKFPRSERKPGQRARRPGDLDHDLSGRE